MQDPIGAIASWRTYIIKRERKDPIIASAKSQAKGHQSGAPRLTRTHASNGNQNALPSRLQALEFGALWLANLVEREFGIADLVNDIVSEGRGRRRRHRLESILYMPSTAVNEEKTRLCSMPKEKFDFPGYTFARLYSMKKERKPYIGARPSQKSIKRMTEAIHAQTDRNMGWMDAGEMANQLNRKLKGWANYFRLGPASKAYWFIDKHAATRIRRWLC